MSISRDSLSLVLVSDKAVGTSLSSTDEVEERIGKLILDECYKIALNVPNRHKAEAKISTMTASTADQESEWEEWLSKPNRVCGCEKDVREKKVEPKSSRENKKNTTSAQNSEVNVINVLAGRVFGFRV